MFIQEQKWRRFAESVAEHIRNYVVPQYGDEDTEPAQEYDFLDCIKQAQRYLARAKTNQRPEGLERDMRKAAHWIQKAWNRLDESAGVAIPIPEGVFYSRATGNFYSTTSRYRMGQDFWELWNSRHAEFPQEGEEPYFNEPRG